MASTQKGAAKETRPNVEQVNATAANASTPKNEPMFKLSHKSILIGVAGLLVSAGAAVAYYALSNPREATPAITAVKPVVFIDLPELLVNLSAMGSDRTQRLKVKIVLELSDQSLIQQIQPVMPRLLDTLQTYLRELRSTDLDGSTGLSRVKQELSRRVNASIAPNKVNAVLFKEMIVQ
jgi:flagellar FliL protein